MIDFSEQMKSEDYGTRKLAHYNNWLLNEKRTPGEPYPGFPEDLMLAAGRARLQAEFAERAAKKVEKAALPEKKGKATKVKKPKTPAKSKKTRDSSEGPTKQERANAIYTEFGGDKLQIIAAIQHRLGMSQAGATTYFYNAKKAAC